MKRTLFLGLLLAALSACGVTNNPNANCDILGNCPKQCNSVWGCDDDCGIWGCAEDKAEEPKCDFYGNCK